VNKVTGSCAIGIDIGGTYTKVGLVAEDGSVRHLQRIPTASHCDPASYLDQLHALISQHLAEKPVGIGISLPGFHSPDGHCIQFNPNTPALVGIDFFNLFQRHGLPVRIEQDLNTPALAEYYYGSGRGSQRFMAATIGTGVGVGVILNGQVLRFTGNSTGDAGHIILDPEGPQCQVGCHGCAEAMVTIAAIEREAERVKEQLDFSLQPDQMAIRGTSAYAVIQASHQGNQAARGIIETIGRRLGQWLASVAPIFLPDRIALCGGVAEAGEPLLRACLGRFLELAGPDYTHCEVVIGHHRELAGVIGAGAGCWT
jgi:glucokinase